MGGLELRKVERDIEFKDGKLVIKLPVNWDATLKLWYQDEDAYNNKTLVRFEDREVFIIYYNKWSATYNNKSYYQFFPNSVLKGKLAQNIRQGKIDAPYKDKNVHYDK